MRCFLLKEIVRNSLLLIKRRLFTQPKRNQSVTRKEYDEGSWQRILLQKSWKGYEQLEDYLCDRGNRRVLTCLIDGQVSTLPQEDYYRLRRDNVVAHLMRFAGGEEELVELGCGCGTNLFSLRSVPTAFRRLRGLDVSPTALQAAREIAAHFRVPDVDFQHIDLLDRAHPAFQALKEKTVFTYHCLEQLRHSMGLVIDAILKSCPKRVIHIEPTREVLNPFCLLDLNCIVYSLAMDYPDNLLQELAARQRRGALQIICQERLWYSPTLRHTSVLIVWEPAMLSQC